MSGNSKALQPERRPVTLEAHQLDTASEQADWRAATTGLWLADFECRHGLLGGCDECEVNQ